MKFFIRMKSHKRFGYVIESGEFYIDSFKQTRTKIHSILYSSLSKQLIVSEWRRVCKRYSSRHFTIHKFTDQNNFLASYAVLIPIKDAFNVPGIISK